MMKKRLFTALVVLSVLMISGCGANSEPAEASEPSTEAEQVVEAEPKETGPSVEELEAQAKEAIDKEDYDTALALAKEAGAIDASSETKIKDMVKDAYLSKIDALIGEEDYEAAHALITEGNEKLGSSDLDSKLSELPYAVANGVEFTTIDEVDGHLFIAFYEEKGDDIYRVTGPEFTFKDKDCKVKISDITLKNTGDGYKEYIIKASVDAAYTVSHPVTSDKTYWFTDTPLLQFFDYYTGLVINSADLTMEVTETSKEGDKENVVSWHGVDYPIEITAEKKRNDPSAGEESTEGGMSIFKRNDHKDFTYTVRCPEDYDGLCVYLLNASKVTDETEEKRWNKAFDASGKFVEDTEAESNKTKYMFQYPDLDNEVHTPDFYLMMRITDDIASEEVSAAKNNGTATNSQKAKANAEAPSEQTLASTQPTLQTEQQ